MIKEIQLDWLDPEISDLKNGKASEIIQEYIFKKEEENKIRLYPIQVLATDFKYGKIVRIERRIVCLR